MLLEMECRVIFEYFIGLNKYEKKLAVCSVLC